MHTDFDILKKKCQQLLLDCVKFTITVINNSSSKCLLGANEIKGTSKEITVKITYLIGP